MCQVIMNRDRDPHLKFSVPGIVFGQSVSIRFLEVGMQPVHDIHDLNRSRILKVISENRKWLIY